MTAVREVRLWCDHRDPPPEGSRFGLACHKEFDAPTDLGFVRSITVMRKTAAKAGWTHVPSHLSDRRSDFGKDYCPKHSLGED